jgi:adenosine/AMP kinase
MQFISVTIEKPENTNFILGQTHFIKSVEDIHEALVTAVREIKFGLAFCEASGKCLVRWSGTDSEMVELAQKNAAAIAKVDSGMVNHVARCGRVCSRSNCCVAEIEVLLPVEETTNKISGWFAKQ